MKRWKPRIAVLVTCLLALTAGVVAASLAATTPEQPGSSASGSGMLPAPARTPASRPPWRRSPPSSRPT